MIENEWIAGNGDIEKALEIRRQVFGESGEKDGADEYAMHLIVYDDGVPAAAGRIFVGDGNRFCISHLCVIEFLRGQGLGDLAAKLLLYKSFEFTGELYAEIPSELDGFFARYGFVTIGTDGTKDHIYLEKEKCVYPSKCSEGAGL